MALKQSNEAEFGSNDMDVDLVTEFESKCSISLPQTTRIDYLPHPLCNGEFLVRHNAVMAGSAAVKFFFPKDTWLIGDVDVFISDFNVDAMYDELQRMGWKKCRNPKYKREPDYKLRFPVAHDFRMRYLDCVLNIVVYDIGKGAKSEDIRRLIDTHFDINGCTISWNGCDWHLRSDMSFSDFLERKWAYIYKDPFTMFDVNYRINEMVGELGFTKTHALLAISRLIDLRLKKYTDRGFNIVNATDIRLRLFEKLVKHPEWE